MTNVRGSHGRFFFHGLGLSLGAKLVSTNDRPSYSSMIFRLFPSGAEKKNAQHFHQPNGGTRRHMCRKFRENVRRVDLPAFNVEQNLARKLDPTLKPSNLKEISYLTHFYAQMCLNVPAVFERWTLKFRPRVLHAHPEA